MNAQNMPLVSIVVPIYATEEYLEKCLDSILAQTYSCLEVICVNDASPGNAEAVIQSYAAYDNRVKLKSLKENKGLFHARLQGAESACGTYLMFVDSDDYLGNVTLTINGSKKISVPQGDSVMAVLNQNGIFLPSACGGKASCGQCKVQVLEGGGEKGPVVSIL